jgi:polyisoprenoid-binding protein YceI
MPKIYQIVPELSEIRWTGSWLMGGSHSGTVIIRSGQVLEDNNELSGGQVVVDMTTVENTDIRDEGRRKRLENHLHSREFFDTREYPLSELFIFTTEKLAELHRYKFIGDLRIKDVTHPVEFEGYALKAKRADEYHAKATLILDRTKWDVRYGSLKFYLNLGDRVIKDEFELVVDIVARADGE